MDFSKPFITVPNVVSKAKIRYIPLSTSETSTTDQNDAEYANKLDRMVIEASNRAASELILSNDSSFHISKKYKTSSSTDLDTYHKQHQHLVDTSLYPTYIRATQDCIQPQSLVVLYESFDSISFTYATPGSSYTNRHGTFLHNDFIHKNYGCKIQSTNKKGYLYILKPTPELWIKTLNHRTQIIHESDAALIIFQLDLRPNQIVCESGTGSGAFSHCILRSIAPFGKLFTYEFNQARVKAAREEFQKNGVSHMVQVYWRDVCGEVQKEHDTMETICSKVEEKEMEEVMGQGGFNIGSQAAHAISLDLPQPWLAIPHAAYTLVPNGRLCSYSPCIEQVQKTIQALKKYRFHSIQTFEVRLREYYLDKVVMEQVPTKKLPRIQNIRTPWIPNDSSSVDPTSIGTTTAIQNEDILQGVETINPRLVDLEDVHVEETLAEEYVDTHPKMDEKLKSSSTSVLCARPFPMIKGHSAFLTFATAPINP